MDPKEMEKQYAELQKSVAALREILESKFSAEKQKEERDKLYAEILAKVNPAPKSIMKWAVLDKDGKIPEHGIFFSEFLKAVTPGKEHSVSPEALAHVKATMISGTDSLGGYAVPTEFSNEIIILERANSIARQLCRIFPMNTDTRNFPRQLTNVAVTWTAESAEKTDTNITLSQLQQVAKKLAAVVKMSDELIEDNNVNIDKFIMELVAEAMGLEEDRVVFAGDVSGASDPFNGVLFASGVNNVAQLGGNLAGDDIINLIMSLNAKYRQGSTIVTSTAGLKLLMKLKTSDGTFIWSPPTAGVPGLIWGYNYAISDQIPSTLGAGSDREGFIFGNFKKHFFISDRGGYEVKSSISASDTASSESAFMQDETWFRFKKRMSLDVAQAEAFSKLLAK